MSDNKVKKLRINIPELEESVSGLHLKATEEKALLVLAHGAGAGMTHPFMEQISETLAAKGVSTLRFNFPYMEKGGRRPDSPKVAHAGIRAALKKGKEFAGTIPLLMGGKSFGGRMSSQLAAAEGLSGASGLVFLGFPLHAVGKAGTERAEHLKAVSLPMLFLQGTRDALADQKLISQVCKKLKPATLVFYEGADHSFKTLKRSGISQEEVILAMAEKVALWASKL